MTPGTIDIAHIFRDVRGKPFNADHCATIRLNRMMDARDHREAVVPIRRLFATQRAVNDDFGYVQTRHPDGDPYRLPAVVRYDGALYVTDGHHRIVARAIAGECFVEIRLFDLDDMDEDAPLLERMVA